MGSPRPWQWPHATPSPPSDRTCAAAALLMPGACDESSDEEASDNETERGAVHGVLEFCPRRRLGSLRFAEGIRRNRDRGPVVAKAVTSA